MRNSLSDSVNSMKAQVFLLPDDIWIYCILIRLDVSDIVRCRYVCKRWMDLTSTPQFEELRSLIMPPVSKHPMILAQTKSGVFCIDNWWATTRSLIHKVGSNYNYHYNYFSQNGFILKQISSLDLDLELRYEYIVCNPLTHEQVKIVLFGEKLLRRFKFDMVGIYLHPIHKEYRMLWRFRVQGSILQDSNIQYKMLNLGSKPITDLWRNIDQPRTTHFQHEYADAVYCFNDGFMYWWVYDFGKGSIMAFDIITEGLTEILLLPDDDDGLINHEFFYPPNLVINDDGCVSLVQLGLDKKVITVKISTLKNGRFCTGAPQKISYQNQWGIERPTFLFHGPRAVAIANHELVFQIAGDNPMVFQSKQLFVCNIQSGTLRKLKEYPKLSAWFRAHHPTIASLRNCPPVIHITMQEIRELTENAGITIQ